ncbi:MAG: amino acid ABC transporter substrate-binding protein [Clostridiales bacterium]|nr:MAG: amino acid ABC transporter substrate-binding protein [Clostridiales bacterium]
MHEREDKMKNLSILKKMLLLALSAAMLLTVLTGCGSSETAAPQDEQATEAQAEEQPAAEASTLLEQIKAKGKLVVGTEAQYAPYEFKDFDANFVGCDMWLAQQIADSLGVELEIVDMSFAGIIPAVQSGQVDLGIAAFTNTPERAEEIDFSDLYETSAQLLIVKTGNADTYSTKEALAGQKVGAQKGTIQSQLIQSALPDSELFELEKYPALALEVQNGNIAGLVVDQAVGESLVANSNGELEVSNFEFSAEEASFGKSVVIAKGNEDLVAAVNEVVNKVTSDGSYQAAYDEAVALAATLGM